MEVVEIEILGRRYALQSDRPAIHVRAVASYVDERLRELSGGDPAAVRRDHAILAALNIASELFLLKDQLDVLQDDVAQTVADVVRTLDVAFAESAADEPSGDGAS